MIAEGRSKQALHALNSVLVVARLLAYERRPYKLLAQVLDVAELLPMLIARADDTTVEFRAYVAELLRLDKRFGMALKRFDEP